MSKKIISAAIDGKIIAIENVNDPVFAEKMLGDGIAIRPMVKKSIVVAPCSGTIRTLQDSKHAVALVTGDGVEVLIHIGVDTVLLKGEGFKSFVKVGDKVNKGDNLIEVDFALIESKVPSIDVIFVITNLSEEQKLVKTTSSEVKIGDDLFAVTGSSENIEISSSSSSEGQEVLSDMCRIINETGVHARPASMIFEIASKHKSTVSIKKGDKVANAKSIISILGLGIKFNEEVQVIARGEDAKAAVEALVAAINSGLGEVGSHAHSGSSNVKNNSNNASASNAEEVYSGNEQDKDYDFSKEVTLKGVASSPGLVIGKSFFLAEEYIDVNENGEGLAIEKDILKNALENVTNIILGEINEAKAKKQSTKIEVFEAHLNILKDESLVSEAYSFVDAGKSASFSWRGAIKNSIDIINSTKDKLLMERVADLKDIELRVIKSILGLESDGRKYPKDAIIIAKDLVPSDVVQFEDSDIAGVILCLGSSTSHVSLILRNMGIPTLVAVGSGISKLVNNTNVVLDANKAIALVNPSENKLQDIRIEQEQLDKIKSENIANAKKPAVTIDGVNVTVKGNVSNAKEVDKARDLGAEGVGLLRTEFLFFNSKTAPTEEVQHGLYQGAVDLMQGGTVTLRTLDVGGDKPLSYVKIGHEENPIMGMRGVRNYFTNKEIFLTQLRAILKVKPLMLVKIMIPMVAEVSEIIKIKEIIEEEKVKLGIKDKIQIGTMIEVPSSAIIADKIAQHVDFLSIGTNDLAQYVLAMDRGHPILTSRLQNLHPAILRLIKMTVDGGNIHNIPTAVCGAMASEIISIPILIGLGVLELSTSMKSIPDVRALVRSLSHAKCKEVADKALTLSSAEEVIQLVRSEFNL